MQRKVNNRTIANPKHDNLPESKCLPRRWCSPQLTESRGGNSRLRCFDGLGHPRNGGRYRFPAERREMKGQVANVGEVSTYTRSRHPRAVLRLELPLRVRMRRRLPSADRDREWPGRRLASGAGLGQHDPRKHQSPVARHPSTRQFQASAVIPRRAHLPVQPTVRAERDDSESRGCRLAHSADALPGARSGSEQCAVGNEFSECGPVTPDVQH